MTTDQFGNTFAAGLPYARGSIIRSTEDDFVKLQRAHRVIERRIAAAGREAIFNFSGLERGLPLEASELALADDEVAPALVGERVRALALEHLGGDPRRHDVMLFNRLTAATFATHLALVTPGDTVLGLSPTYTHPTAIRSARQCGARFVETGDIPGLSAALEREPRVTLLVLTRLAVTYDLLPLETAGEAVRLAHARGVRVYVDDAGGARVGPAVFGQPKTLELGADLGATGLDKYGIVGPRLGLLAGDAELVAAVRARAFEFGLEARPMLYPAVARSLAGYRPERVRALVETTRKVGEALRAVFGARLHVTPVTAQLRADDVLTLAMERAGLTTPPIVPIEATAALAMLLLEDYGVLTVHFAGMPPGTSSLLLKFIPPETLERFGGADALAKAVDSSLDRLAALLRDRAALSALLLGATVSSAGGAAPAPEA
jgi:L-seryl-tRNA(Ser) seleniumtransferase